MSRRDHACARRSPKEAVAFCGDLYQNSRSATCAGQDPRESADEVYALQVPLIGADPQISVIRQELGWDMNDNGVQTCFMLSRCRTGSTSLLKAITQNSRASAYAEIFNPTKSYSYQSYLFDWLSAAAERKTSFLEGGPLCVFDEYMEELRSKEKALKPELRLFVFECKLENSYVFSDNWTHPTMNFSTSAIIRRSLAISQSAILLRRKNVLERFFSDVTARLTGIFHSDEGTQSKRVTKIKVHVADIVRNMKEEIEIDDSISSYMKSNILLFSELYYEDIYAIDGFNSEFVTDFKYIGNGINLDAPTLRKVRTLGGRDLVENFDELCRAFAQEPELAWMVSGEC